MNGKNASAMRTYKDDSWKQPWLTLDTALVHVIGGLILIGYAQNYYFHLRMLLVIKHKDNTDMLTTYRSPQEQRPLDVSI